MNISISCEQLERVETLLYGIPRGTEEATAIAINKGLDKIKSESSKEIRKRYAISSGNLRQNETIKLKRASKSGSTVGYIKYSGKKIPLFRFTPNPKGRTYTGIRKPVMIGNVTALAGTGGAAIWQVVGMTSKTSGMDIRATGYHSGSSWFIANFKSGHTGIFKRTKNVTSTGKYKVEELWGPAVADMLDYEPSREQIQKDGQETVNRELEAAIGRILARY